MDSSKSVVCLKTKNNLLTFLFSINMLSKFTSFCFHRYNETTPRLPQIWIIKISWHLSNLYNYCFHGNPGNSVHVTDHSEEWSLYMTIITRSAMVSQWWPPKTDRFLSTSNTQEYIWVKHVELYLTCNFWYPSIKTYIQSGTIFK